MVIDNDILEMSKRARMCVVVKWECVVNWPTSRKVNEYRADAKKFQLPSIFVVHYILVTCIKFGQRLVSFPCVRLSVTYQTLMDGIHLWMVHYFFRIFCINLGFPNSSLPNMWKKNTILPRKRLFWEVLVNL